MRLPRLLRTATLAALTLAALPAIALERPADERFQAWLQQLGQQHPALVTGQFEDDDVNRRLARAILDRLWDAKDYRENLHAWLDTHQAVSAEDLLADWLVHYHRAYAASLEFADHSESALWRLSRTYAIGAIDRAQCAQATPQAMQAWFLAAHAKLLAEQADELARVLPAGLAREFARENHPRPGDRPVDQVMALIAQQSLKAVAATLPPDDGARLVARFSYVPPDQRHPTPASERCEQDWVVSHAIDDSRVEDPARHASSLLLRSTVTITSYQTTFEDWDDPHGARPARRGFKPGQATIALPAVLSQQHAAGVTRVRIRVDEAGRLQDAALVSSTVQPAQVRSIDGSTLRSSDLLLAVVDAYYRGGAFEPHLVDGVARPDQFDVEFSWQ